MISASPHVALTRHGVGGHVVDVALDRPEAMNAISTEFATEIAATMEGLAADDTVGVVVLSSHCARAFCVGADLKERSTMSGADLLSLRDTHRAAYRSVLDLPMPAVAAVDGFALGGGLELALSCDLVVAAEQSELALPEVSVGLIPGGGGTALLTRRVGWSRACSMIFTGARVTAQEAWRLGVVDEVVGAGEARERALVLAASIVANSPSAVRNAKQAMRVGFDIPLPDALEFEDRYWRQAVAGADRIEGIAAFNEKRSPVWQVSTRPNV